MTRRAAGRPHRRPTQDHAQDHARDPEHETQARAAAIARAERYVQEVTIRNDLRRRGVPEHRVRSDAGAILAIEESLACTGATLDPQLAFATDDE